MKICFISPMEWNSLVLPVDVDLGPCSAFCLLKTRRFLTLGVDTEIVTWNAVTENL